MMDSDWASKQMCLIAATRCVFVWGGSTSYGDVVWRECTCGDDVVQTRSIGLPVLYHIITMCRKHAEKYSKTERAKKARTRRGHGDVTMLYGTLGRNSACKPWLGT
jgi:hypothetical protein